MNETFTLLAIIRNANILYETFYWHCNYLHYMRIVAKNIFLETFIKKMFMPAVLGIYIAFFCLMLHLSFRRLLTGHGLKDDTILGYFGLGVIAPSQFNIINY